MNSFDKLWDPSTVVLGSADLERDGRKGRGVIDDQEEFVDQYTEYVLGISEF